MQLKNNRSNLESDQKLNIYEETESKAILYIFVLKPCPTFHTASNG